MFLSITSSKTQLIRVRPSIKLITNTKAFKQICSQLFANNASKKAEKNWTWVFLYQVSKNSYNIYWAYKTHFFSNTHWAYKAFSFCSIYWVYQIYFFYIIFFIYKTCFLTFFFIIHIKPAKPQSYIWRIFSIILNFLIFFLHLPMS